MYGEIARGIAQHFHAEHLSTRDLEDDKLGDGWVFVFRLGLSRIVPDSHRASWSHDVYVDSRQRVYFVEVYIPAAMLSVDWLNTINAQIEQHLAQLTFTEVNPTVRILIAPAPAAAATA